MIRNYKDLQKEVKDEVLKIAAGYRVEHGIIPAKRIAKNEYIEDCLDTALKHNEDIAIRSILKAITADRMF